MMYKTILPVFVATFLLSTSFAGPVDQQIQPQAVQVQAETEVKIPENEVPTSDLKPAEQPEVTPLPDAAPILPVNAEEKSDLDTANTFWGGYYRRPYYGGWGGYGGGWKRGWGGYGGYGSGYGYGRGFGGYGGWGGWGNRYYWG